MKRYKKTFWIGIGILCLMGSGTFSLARADGPIKVMVSILPQKTFVEKIGGSLVDVSVMVEPGASPHTYEPKPRQMAALAKTGIYFSIGVTFEDVWLKRIANLNPKMRVVRTDKDIKKIPMVPHERQHGSSHLDPHVWLSPPLVKILARNMLQGLIEVDSVNRTTYRTGFQNFVVEIDRLDRDFSTIFSGRKGLEFLVFHPSWGYFADAYGLKQVPIEIEGKEPKPAQLKHLIEHARDRGIRVIFVQPQASTKSAETIARAIGGQVIIADPLAEDWIGNLRKQADKIKRALR